MFKIKENYTLETLKTHLHKYKIPSIQEITTSVLEVMASDIKTIKGIIKDLKDKKKTAEAPHEKDRKEAQDKLELAKGEKQKAGTPYAELITSLSETEESLRKLILDYNNLQEENARIAKLQQEKLEAEAAEAKRLADLAVENARRTGNKEDAIKAFTAQEKATKAENASDNVVIPEVVKATGVSTVNRASYKVVDISKVPNEYVEYVPDLVKIDNTVKALLANMPYITNIKFSIDVDSVPDEYMCDQVIHEKVLCDIRRDVEIPGIEKITVEHVAIR